MQDNENNLYDSLVDINKNISIKKYEIDKLNNEFDILLLQLAKKHYKDLLALENGTLKYNSSYEFIPLKTNYDKEKNIYYFQGTLFKQNNLIEKIKRKLETNSRGNKILKNMYGHYWFIENINQDEVSTVSEVLKYELETRLINGNIIN